MARGRERLTILWLSLLLAVLVACGGGATATPAQQPTAAPATRPAATAGSPAAGGASPAATRPATAASPTASGAASPTGGARATPAGSPGASPRAAATPRTTSYPLTITDDAGRTVTLKARPQKIASLAPSNTETLYALGLGDRVVGVDEFSDYPEAAKAKPKIGGFFQLNVEPVVALAPDLVLAAGIHSKDYIAAVEGKGLTVVVLAAKDLPGVLDDLSLVGQLADVNAEAARVRDGLQGRMDAVGDRLKGAGASPRVYFEVDPTFYTAGPNSFIDDLIKRAGGANIAADAPSPFPQLSAEAIVAKDPEVIVLSDSGAGGVTVDAVKARPGWAGVSAVKNNRVVAIDGNLASRPGPRVFDALEQLAKVFHPEAFR